MRRRCRVATSEAVSVSVGEASAALKNLKHIRSADFDTPYLRPALQLDFLLVVIDVRSQTAYAT